MYTVAPHMRDFVGARRVVPTSPGAYAIKAFAGVAGPVG